MEDRLTEIAAVLSACGWTSNMSFTQQMELRVQPVGDANKLLGAVLHRDEVITMYTSFPAWEDEV